MKKTGKFLEISGLCVLVLVALLFNPSNATFIQTFVSVCAGLLINRLGTFMCENWEEYDDTI